MLKEQEEGTDAEACAAANSVEDREALRALETGAVIAEPADR